MVDVEFKIISVGEIKEAEMVRDKCQISLITRALPGVNGTTLSNPEKKRLSDAFTLYTIQIIIKLNLANSVTFLN